mmetsp:Transcript_11201/g.28374  ORF Transcript_11201/g.28374 Transcript_11201/m.28374 type:complete len:459 (+) Transcript_11201:330-1706(+)
MKRLGVRSGTAGRQQQTQSTRVGVKACVPGRSTSSGPSSSHRLPSSKRVATSGLRTGNVGRSRMAASQAVSESSGAQQQAPAYPTVKAFVATVEDLRRLSELKGEIPDSEPNAAGLRATLEGLHEALGREGLGIIAVRGVEGLAEARQNLLPLADRLANLQQSELEQLEDAESSYSIGWSHGKETLEGGVPDTFKGSFYANPVHNKLEVTQEELESHPSYCRPNIWPAQSIPELRPAFMTLGTLIVEHGKILAKVCDNLVRKELGLASEEDLGVSSIERAIEDSFAAKARLLHYFPPPENESLPESSAGEDDKMGNWCGWHLDHGSLTGLTGAMFTDCHESQVDNPDPENCGLYVRSRKGDVVRVTYAKDCVAYQVGEVSEIMSNGVLKATPHCVVGASGEKAAGVARNTFAVFMQPKWDLALRAAEDKKGVGLVETKGYTPGITFGDFTTVKLDEYY